MRKLVILSLMLLPAVSFAENEFENGLQKANQAMKALKHKREAVKKRVQVLIAKLKEDCDYETIARIVAELGKFGPESKEAVPALIDLLKKNARIRYSAAKTLVKIGPEAVPALLAVLEDDNVCNCAVKALGEIGPAAVPALIDVFKGTDADMRSCAAEALGKIRSEAKAAVPALIAALTKDADAKVCHYAVEALGKIRSEAKAAVPALIAALITDARVRGEATIALGKIGPEAKAAVPALVVALKDVNWNVRCNAAIALGQIGPEAVPTLIKVLEACDDEAMRKEIINALHIIVNK